MTRSRYRDIVTHPGDIVGYKVEDTVLFGGAEIKFLGGTQSHSGTEVPTASIRISSISCFASERDRRGPEVVINRLFGACVPSFLFKRFV